MSQSGRRKATNLNRQKQCKPCQHSKRATIDKLLAKGKPVNAIAKAYGLTESSLRRHLKHIRAVVTKAAKQRERRRIDSMVNVYDEYSNDLREINAKIKACTNDELCQGWYETKRKRLDMALKYRFLGEWLGRGDGTQNGNGSDHAKRTLPEAVQRVIDAVVSNDD